MRAGDLAIVVATRNRRDELDRTLGHLGSLPEQPTVVVVDNASSDGTADAVADRHHGVETIRLHENLGAAARNVGAESARSELVAFCDDDTWWEPGSLTTAARVFETNPRAAVVTARMLVGPDDRVDPTCLVMAESPLRSGAETAIPVVGFIAGASMVRRRPFLECGGFSPRYVIGGEEELLAIDLLTAGWSLHYLPEAVVHHHPSPSRNRRRRDRMHVRNRIWTTWLRRPAGTALRRTGQILRDADPGSALLGAVDALAATPWVAGQRRIVPPHVEAVLRTVESPRNDGPDRAGRRSGPDRLTRTDPVSAREPTP